MNNLKIKRVENEELSLKTKRALLDIIRDTPDDNKPFKLPNEDELSRALNVSRNVLRDALMSLEEIGVVTRRRSIGTIANPKIAKECGRLDTSPELAALLEEKGYSVRVETHRLGFVFENNPVFGPEEDSYLNAEKIFYANDIPVAFCNDQIRGLYAKRGEDSIITLKNTSHYDFLKAYCETSLAYSMAHVDAVTPEPWLVKSLNLSPGEPVLMLDDYAYNHDHDLIVHSVIYFRSGYLDLKFLRKSW